MAKIFISHSKEVVDDFIQNIVFVDDRAYSKGEVAQDFDAAKVMSIFASKGKLCAIYTPAAIGNEDVFSMLLSKADAVILDWDMRINPLEAVYKKNDGSESPAKEDEADDEADDPRGDLACKLIRNIATKTSGIKVILIYTGDKHLTEICETVKNCVENAKYDEQTLSVTTDNIIIAIRAKDQDSEEQFKHNPQLKEFIVNYEDMPQCIIDQYVRLTNGLISNFALRALTTIRNNTPQILSVFSPLLDNGYIAHKASMEFPEDARLLLIKLFGDALSDLLSCEMPSTSEWTESWIDDTVEEEDITINTIDIHRTRELLKQIMSSHQTTLAEKVIEILKKDLGKEDIKQIKSSGPEITVLFRTKTNDLNESNIRFAELTHHKNIFTLTPVLPVLSLGSIIKDSMGNLFICIQQRCDSVRVTKKRKFLFLPLVPDGKNPIIINRRKYCPSRKSFAIQTIDFTPQNRETVISAINKDGKFVFVADNKDEYEWIVDLKAMHAQRIANEYCSQLGRVGLDESEWLRLHGIQ